MKTFKFAVFNQELKSTVSEIFKLLPSRSQFCELDMVEAFKKLNELYQNVQHLSFNISDLNYGDPIDIALEWGLNSTDNIITRFQLHSQWSLSRNRGDRGNLVKKDRMLLKKQDLLLKKGKPEVSWDQFNNCFTFAGLPSLVFDSNELIFNCTPLDNKNIKIKLTNGLAQNGEKISMDQVDLKFFNKKRNKRKTKLYSFNFLDGKIVLSLRLSNSLGFDSAAPDLNPNLQSRNSFQPLSELSNDVLVSVPSAVEKAILDDHTLTNFQIQLLTADLLKGGEMEKNAFGLKNDQLSHVVLKVDPSEVVYKDKNVDFDVLSKYQETVTRLLQFETCVLTSAVCLLKRLLAVFFSYNHLVY
jgi:hypothetical protein